MTRRVSRRAFIAGAGAIAAAGGSAALLATHRDSRPRSAIPEPTTEPSASPIPGASPAPPPRKRGGIATITSPSSFSFDTFDAQLSGSSSVVEILGRTHSRLLNWDGRSDANLIPDLAARWEQPDAQTVVFHLDPAARWQDRQPLNGRALTAEDVVAHFRRTLELAVAGNAPLAQRYHDYAAVASVDSPAAGQVRFRLHGPDPLFLGTLAGEYSLIQAPEAVAAFAGLWSKLDSDHVIGTGPWVFDWSDNGAKFIASPAGHRQPLLDELRVFEPREQAVRFLNAEVHEAVVRDRREAEAIRSKLSPELLGPPGDVGEANLLSGNAKTYEFHRFEREFVMSSFVVGAPPWNNPALITALSGGLNRSQLSRSLFGGRARAAPPILGAISAERLKFVPGYAHLEGDAPLAPEWRQRWQAAGGPGLGTVTIDFPSVFDPLYSASSVVIQMLNEALGPQFRPAVETYATISKRVLDGYYGNGRTAFWFGWGPPLPGPDRARYWNETYAPGSPGQRVTRGQGITGWTQDEMLKLTESGFLGIVPWVQQYAEVFRRPGHSAPYPTPFWTQHLDYTRWNT